MLDKLKKLVGDSQSKKLNTYYRRVAEINKLEPDIEKLSDDELRAKTVAFKEQLAEGKSIYVLLKGKASTSLPLTII
jgi:preprotein translocase subunit SecA